MLKRIIALLLAVAAIGEAGAKGLTSELGITAGVQLNRMTLSNAPEGMTISPKLGYGAGLHTAFAIGILALQPELNYSYTKANILMPGREVSEMISHDLEVPVLVSLRFLPVIRFNIGPVFNVMSRTACGEEMFGALHYTFGYAGGLSLNIASKLLIDLRVTGYFKPSLNQLGGKEFNIDTLWGGIKIGYLF